MAEDKTALEKPIQNELDDLEVVRIFTEMHQEAETAYKPIKEISDVAWNAYNNAFDFSDKTAEQSQSFLPLYKSAIRVAKSIVRKSILASPKYFTVEGLTKESKELAKDVEDTMFRIAEQADFRSHIADASFAAFLENLAVLKIFPAPIEEEDEIISDAQQVKMIVDPISVPNDFRLDPKGRKLYIMHRIDMDLSDYELLVEGGEYTRKSLEAAQAEYVAQEETLRKQREQGMQDAGKPSWRKTVELWEVWTRALCRQDGTAIARNVMFTVLNRKHLARKVTKYLYRNNKTPFIYSPVADKPFSVYHENFGEPVLGMLDAIIDLMNSLVDAAQNVATKGFEISIDQVRNPSAISRGIYGGKVIKTTTPPIPGLTTVRPFDVGEFSPQALQFLSWMVQQFHNGIGITELLSGIPGLGEKTATEITTKTQAAMGNINEVAQILDKHLVGPGLRQMFELMMEWNPEVFGNRIAHQVDKSKLKFKFVISGMSGVLARQTELAQLTQIVQLLMSTPLVKELNWTHIGKELLLKNGFKPEEFFVAQASQPPEAGEGATPIDETANAAIANLFQGQ